MKELLEHIVKSIVNHPDAVSVEEKDSVDFPGLTILTIDVAEDDKGVVIGRRGRTINAIRDLITINAIRNDSRVKVLLKDDNRPVSDEPKVQAKDKDMLYDEEI
jgi:predicted RNA-binding protein YlqC (UPF0109 family)